MKEKLEILKSWISTGQVVTAKGRHEDDLLTLIGQMEVELNKQESLMKEIKIILDDSRISEDVIKKCICGVLEEKKSCGEF